MRSYITDEYGRWAVKGIIKSLVEPSQKWIDENQPQEPVQDPPTEMEELTNYLLDVDFRLVMVEMGIL